MLMEFRIADTFTDSLAALANDEQKAVKTTAFDLQLNPANPGMQFHKLDKAKDPNFWSVRVSQDIRLIVHRTASSLMLCYVGHHDEAYRWAERRKIERHPTTGAAQLVEVRESVREIIVPRYVEAPVEKPPAKPLFVQYPDWVLLTYGVPPEWMRDVRAATEETLFDIADHLPHEAAEALLELATGTPPPLKHPGLPPHVDAFEHPDAQRRFRVIKDVEELEAALDAPWEKWIVFLHPAQRRLVEDDYSGPARTSGSAGTGKTIVALHRRVHPARKADEARVLLTTFSEPLANALRSRLRLLIGNQPRLAERLEVHAIGAIAKRLYEAQIGRVNIASEHRQREIVRDVAAQSEAKFNDHFVWTEWSTVVDEWQVRTWDDYREVKRLGRKTRLPETQRTKLWAIFEAVREQLAAEHLLTQSEVFDRLATHLRTVNRALFDYVVIDESQDLSVAGLRFLAALGADRPNSLFFTGDLGQRIFQQPFSWRELGVDIRGRSTRLKINYRTSHQIRAQADRLLASQLSDVDGIVEARSGTFSVFNGAPPTIAIEANESAERKRVTEWIKARTDEGLRPNELAIFVRSSAELSRAESAAKDAGLQVVMLDDNIETRHDRLSIGSMHLAKGLEFRAVAVMACDDEIIPSQNRVEEVGDESDLEDVYQTERHLLYVACTRARDHLLVTGIAPGSEFLADMRG